MANDRVRRLFDDEIDTDSDTVTEAADLRNRSNTTRTDSVLRVETLSEANFAEDDLKSPEADGTEADGEHKGKKEKSAKKELLDWVKVVLIALAAALIVNCFVIINSVVPSGSMEQTIMTHSRMFGYRLAYIFNDPERSDIIIFKYPVDESQIFVKRIIGLPGDTVEIKRGVTYVNGEVLDEPYLNETPYDLDFGPYNVPEGSYFVMGDNRNHSNDARYWEKDGEPVNFVTRKEILAKAVLCYWPLNRFGALK